MRAAAIVLLGAIVGFVVFLVYNDSRMLTAFLAGVSVSITTAAATNLKVSRRVDDGG